MERLLVTLDFGEREETFEVTRDVEEVMSLTMAPGLPLVLLESVREAAIMRAARQVIKAQAQRKDIHLLSRIMVISRVPSSIIPLDRFPSLAETSP